MWDIVKNSHPGLLQKVNIIENESMSMGTVLN